MSINRFQPSAFFIECFEKNYEMRIPRIFSADMYEPADTDGITGEEIIRSAVYKIIELNESPDEIVMRDMARFLESLQAILDRHINSGLSHDDAEYARSYLKNLTSLYHELLQCGVKTIPFDPPEVVYARFVEGVQQYKAWVESIPDEELRSRIVTVMFQAKTSFLLDHQPVVAKIKISRWCSYSPGAVSFAAHSNLEFKEKGDDDEYWSYGSTEKSDSIIETLEKKIAWIAEHQDFGEDRRRIDETF